MLQTNLMAATGWVHYSHYCSVAQSCPTLFNHMDCSTPGFPVLHHLPDLVQIHVHWVGDASQPSHPLSSPSPPAFNLSQHQGLFQWVSSSHSYSYGYLFPQWAKSFIYLLSNKETERNSDKKQKFWEFIGEWENVYGYQSMIWV